MNREPQGGRRVWKISWNTSVTNWCNVSYISIGKYTCWSVRRSMLKVEKKVGRTHLLVDQTCFWLGHSGLASCIPFLSCSLCQNFILVIFSLGLTPLLIFVASANFRQYFVGFLLYFGPFFMCFFCVIFLISFIKRKFYGLHGNYKTNCYVIIILLLILPQSL